jgi:hypothetical protein
MQVIKFEFADSGTMNSGVLSTINQLAIESPEKDVRVTDDGNSNIKVYVGAPYLEDHRYWIYIDGRIILKEEDVRLPEDVSSVWQAVVDPPAEVPA